MFTLGHNSLASIFCRYINRLLRCPKILIHYKSYLRYILSVLPEWPSNKVAELLPWNVDLTSK
ncbi:hypothetical protein BVG94_25290 (plasmid) [Serratia marcescens]|nr:hypothetical protein BVG94_25290 [Serratia marcescens]